MPIFDTWAVQHDANWRMPAPLHFSQQLTLPGFPLRNLPQNEKPLSKVAKRNNQYNHYRSK